MLMAFNIIAMWIYSTWISIKTRATLHSNLWEHVFIGCMLRVWNNKQYRRGCRSRPSTLYCHNNIESTPQEIIGPLPSSCCTEFKFLQQEIYKYSCLNCDINKAVSESEVPCLQLTRYYGKVYFKVCLMEEHSHQAQPMHHLLSKTTWSKKKYFRFVHNHGWYYISSGVLKTSGRRFATWDKNEVSCRALHTGQTDIEGEISAPQQGRNDDRVRTYRMYRNLQLTNWTQIEEHYVMCSNV